jgi:hypothetical protein
MKILYSRGRVFISQLAHRPSPVCAIFVCRHGAEMSETFHDSSFSQRVAAKLPPRMALLSLPQEIKEEIIGYVDSSRDLLNLALTNRLFNATIIPAHLEYRTVRCSIASRGATALWKAIISKESLAQKIRKLDIRSHSPKLSLTWASLQRRLPAGFPPEFSPSDQTSAYRSREEIEELFISALENMVNLTSFSWNQCSLCGEQGSDLWSALKGCRNLKELRVEDTRYTSSDLGQYDILDAERPIPILDSTVCLFWSQYPPPYSRLSIDVRPVWPCRFQFQIRLIFCFQILHLTI